MTDDKKVVTKDKWAIFTLRAKGFVPEQITQEEDEKTGQKFLLYAFGEDAYDTFDAYMRGEPIPIEDVRLVEQAEREFKNNLHRLFYSR